MTSGPTVQTWFWSELPVDLRQDRLFLSLPIRHFVDENRGYELDDECWEDVSQQHSLQTE